MSEQITVSTVYVPGDRAGYVQVDSSAPAVRLTPEAAQKVASDLLDAANSALADEFLLTWLAQHEMTRETQMNLLTDFRQWREARIGKVPVLRRWRTFVRSLR